jgi:hypothetical protein
MKDIASVTGVGARRNYGKAMFRNVEIVVPTFVVVLSTQTSFRSTPCVFFTPLGG